MEIMAFSCFCQARSVIFAMKTLVEKDLISQGIIEPIGFSEWAAPIVPVLKADKTFYENLWGF